MSPYVRPALCRLCRRPVVDAGVLMATLNLDKLTKWWSQLLQVQFSDQLEDEQICQFCLLDAEFEGEIMQRTDCDWWKGQTTDEVYRKYYFNDEVIRPCEVRISILSSNKPVDSSSDSSTKVDAGLLNQSELKDRRCFPTMCVYCSSTFKSQLACCNHVKLEHKNIRTFKCHPCRTYFKTYEKYRYHTKHDHKKYECRHCSREFRSSSGCREHEENVHQDFTYLHCNYCSLRFKTKAEKNSHLLDAHSDIPYVQCAFCKKYFRLSKIGYHLIHQHKSRAYHCMYNKECCSKFFYSEEEKRKHTLEVHKEQSNHAFCFLCPKVVPKSNLAKHVKTCHKSDYINCNHALCTLLVFKSEAEKEDHIMKVHMATNVLKPHKCIYCDKIFMGPINFNSHVSKTHRKIYIKCKFRGCSTYFFTEAESEKHFHEKHSAALPIKNFKCPKCPVKLENEIRLKSHLSSHFRVSKRCSRCYKLYKSSDEKHKLNCNKIKCVHCNLFPKYIRHHLQVTPCKICGSVFPCVTILQDHKVRQHGCSVKPSMI